MGSCRSSLHVYFPSCDLPVCADLLKCYPVETTIVLDDGSDWTKRPEDIFGVLFALQLTALRVLNGGSRFPRGDVPRLKRRHILLFKGDDLEPVRASVADQLRLIFITALDCYDHLRWYDFLLLGPACQPPKARPHTQREGLTGGLAQHE